MRVACMGEINLYKILVMKPGGKRVLRRMVDGIDTGRVSGCELDLSSSQFSLTT